MKKIVLFVCISSLTLILTACAERYETKMVDAVVIEKEYDPPETKTKKVTQDGQTKTKKVRKAAEYEVLVQYGDIEKEFESPNDKFYKSVEVGGKVKVNLVQGFDEKGKVVSEHLELPNTK